VDQRETDLRRLLLLAAQADTFVSTSQSRDSLLTGLQALSPHLNATLAGHTDGVTSVAFSPDGTTLASASADETIRLWDVATGQQIGEPLQGHTDGVNSMAFSPDGTTLASASADETIRLWDMDWHARACRAAGRNFTAAEWRQYLGYRPYTKTCPEWPVHPSAVEAGLWDE
jgi:WD40 repeat protein